MARTAPYLHWSPAEDAILRREWESGTRISNIVKLLAEDCPTLFSRNKDSVRARRKKLGLPARKIKEVGYDQNSCSFRIDKRTREAADTRCLQLGITLSQYVRRLIKRDLGI